MTDDRLIKFREKVFKKKEAIDGFLVSNLNNIYYLSGFDGEGLALITKENNFLFTDSRYTEQAGKESPQYKIITDKAGKKNARINSLNEMLKKHKMKNLAFEGNNLSYNDFKKYSDGLKTIKLISKNNVIEQIRMKKDKTEIIKIRKAGQIITETLKEIFNIIEPGVRELDIATELAYTMRKKGAKREAFEAIVVSGEGSSLPHGKPSEKIIKEGELITIDTGADYQNYKSDMTRTIILGKENKKQKEIYYIVLEAQKKALESLKPGMKCNEVDKIARDIIKDKGYGKYFGHGLGHGVGLDIHELPRVSSNDKTVLLPGMVITIEPGIYLPKIGGVRIEDTVLITEDGYEILTWFPKTIDI
ncbi:MAG: Xaa-Pro peptidase family protein [Candidatus Caldatribacteriota bacterium]|nr:Xaa-Pro peptidase family protein [Candidatus Caldatribacteriota bacterium]